MLYSKLLNTIKFKTRRIAKAAKIKSKVRVIKNKTKSKTLRLNRQTIISQRTETTSSNRLSENAHFEINKENLQPTDQKANHPNR